MQQQGKTVYLFPGIVGVVNVILVAEHPEGNVLDAVNCFDELV